MMPPKSAPLVISAIITIRPKRKKYRVAEVGIGRWTIAHSVRIAAMAEVASIRRLCGSNTFSLTDGSSITPPADHQEPERRPCDGVAAGEPRHEVKERGAV